MLELLLWFSPPMLIVFSILTCLLRTYRRIDLGLGLLCLSRSAFGLLAIGLPTSGLLGQVDPDAILTSIGEVRRLSEEEAESRPVVQLRGVVSHARDGFFLQDGDEGLYVAVARSNFENFPVAPGDELEVEGEVEVGAFARLVRASKITRLRNGSRPKPRPISFEELSAGVGHCLWVEVRGLVRSVGYEEELRPRIKLEMMVEGRRLSVLIAKADMEDVSWMPDSIVSIRGAAGGRVNRLHQLVRPVLYSNDVADITVLEPPPLEPFGAPAMNVLELRRFAPAPEASVGRRVKVSGEVLWQVPGNSLFIRDESNAVRVFSRQADLLEPGDIVEVLGFPVMGLVTAQLEDATFRKIGVGVDPRSTRVTMKEIMVGLYESNLVEVEATLVAQMPGEAREHIYLAQAGDSVFQAQLTLEEGLAPPNLDVGSRLLFKGICVSTEAGPSGSSDLRLQVVPHSVRLLIRSPEDIAVVHTSPFWTVQRIAWALVGTVLVAAATISLIVVRSRKEVRKAAAAHAETEARFAGVLSERERIAGELHDSVQQSLLGVRLQLEAANRKLGTNPDSAEPHLELAQDLIMRSQEDVRRSIWDLRPQLLESAGLVEAIGNIARQLSDSETLSIGVTVEGEPRQLLAALETDLFRVCQEALTNAIRHGQAQRIEVTLRFEDSSVTLRVSDDGSGFDNSGDLESAGEGHFGLKGMRERMERHRGSIVLESKPSKGTVLLVKVPLK